MLNLLPFFCVIIFCFILSNLDVFSIRISRSSKRYFLILTCLVLAVFAGGRWYDVPYGEGIFDYSVYEFLYKNPLNVSRFWHEYVSHEDIHFRSMEIGYMFLSTFFSSYIFSSPNLFFMLLSFVNVYVLMKGFKSNQITNLIFLVLFIYLTRLYFQYNFIVMRQSLAMSFVWCAIPLIHQKRFWAFLFVCLLSATFHFTALLFVIVYWLPRFNFSNRFLLFALPTLFILSITRTIDSVIFIFAEKVLSFFIGSDSRLLTSYLLDDDDIKGINLLNFVEIIPFLYFAIKFRKDLCQTDRGKFFFNMFIFYILFLLITMNFMVFSRISSYYIYSYFFIISVAYKYIRSYYSKVLLGYVFIIYFTIYAVRFLSANFLIYGYNFFIFHL